MHRRTNGEKCQKCGRSLEYNNRIGDWDCKHCAIGKVWEMAKTNCTDEQFKDRGAKMSREIEVEK